MDVIKPLMDRKILGGSKLTHSKMVWAMNDAFKRGLRNALTGMYVFYLTYPILVNS